MELRELMIIWKNSFYYAPDLQKRSLNKHAKPRNYVPDKKVWYNNKYIKTKWKYKIEVHLFWSF